MKNLTTISFFFILLLSNILTSDVNLGELEDNENEILKIQKDEKIENLATENIKKAKLAVEATTKKIAMMKKKIMEMQKNLDETKYEVNLLQVNPDKSLFKDMDAELKAKNKIQKYKKIENLATKNIKKVKLAIDSTVKKIENMEKKMLAMQKNLDSTKSSVNLVQLNSENTLIKDMEAELKTKDRIKKDTNMQKEQAIKALKEKQRESILEKDMGAVEKKLKLLKVEKLKLGKNLNSDKGIDLNLVNESTDKLKMKNDMQAEVVTQNLIKKDKQLKKVTEDKMKLETIAMENVAKNIEKISNDLNNLKNIKQKMQKNKLDNSELMQKNVNSKSLYLNSSDYAYLIVIFQVVFGVFGYIVRNKKRRMKNRNFENNQFENNVNELPIFPMHGERGNDCIRIL